MSEKGCHVALIPKNLSLLGVPEVFLSTTETRRRVSDWVAAGKARKIGPRLYTTNLVEAPEAVVRRNLWHVVALLLPGYVVSHRTAMELRPAPDGTITLTGPYARTVDLPGVFVRVLAGPGALVGDMPFMTGLFRASEARFLLECLKPHRAKRGSSSGVDRATLEAYLERTLGAAGESRLNAIRDHAREIGPALGAEAQVNVLERLIGALLGTADAPLTAPAAIARAQGEPYDAHRLERFQALVAELAHWPTTFRPVDNTSDQAFVNAAFLDAYFSNYIEGTEFEIDEARRIVFEHQIPDERPADAHDVMSTYQMTASRAIMGQGILALAQDYDAFETILRARHRVIMEGRPEKRPGEFKLVGNRAGNTRFVEPPLVRGTLRRGYELLGAVAEPFARAAYMMFLVAEAHPFADGNGRLARVMMNAELVAASQARVIIPTSYRDDYLGGLRRLSREDDTAVFLEVLDRAQEFVHQIDFTDLDAAIALMTRCNAFDDAAEAILILPSELHDHRGGTAAR